MGSQRVKLKDQILDGIAKSVKEVQAYSCSSDGEVVKISNEDRPLQRLVEYLDHAFLHGLRHITPGYWVFVKRFTHKNLISDIKALDRLATDLGRSRAWLYQSLNEAALESYFRCFLDNDQVLRKHYIEHALLRDSERLSLLMTLVSGLDFVTFDLELNVAYFDLVSHVPRSASDHRDLDDTISLHSNLSIESATSSLFNDGDRNSITGFERRVSRESSQLDADGAFTEEDESIKDGSPDACHDEVSPLSLEDGELHIEGEEPHLPLPGDQMREKQDSESHSDRSQEGADVDSLQDLQRPGTLDLTTQLNDADSNQLKHVTKNFTTPDFDINMEKVADQDQDLEVIRIRKKGKKKKKRKSGKTGQKLKEPKSRLLLGRSPSPGNSSLASSCIEESELERNETGTGSLSSTNIASECSAVEDDVDSVDFRVGSVPNSENKSSDTCSNELQHSLNESKMGLDQSLHGQRDSETDDTGAITEACANLLNEIIDRVCCEKSMELVNSGEYVIIDNCADEVTIRISGGHATKRLGNSSCLDVQVQDSFNASLDFADRSIIYWQGEYTDNSFDADISSSTVGIVGSVELSPKSDDSGDDENVFDHVPEKSQSDAVTKSDLTRSLSDSPVIKRKPRSDASTRTDSQRKRLLKRTVSASLDYDETVHVPLQTVKLEDTAADLQEVVESTEQLLSPDSSEQSGVPSEMSVGVPTCSSESLSSGVGSGPDIIVSTSDNTDSECILQETNSVFGSDNLQQHSSISLVTKDVEDEFVLVDTAGELRHEADGCEDQHDPLHVADVNANEPLTNSVMVTVATAEERFEDADEVTSHDAEMIVDNNLKLYLMLEIFKIENEKFHKLLRLSTGHMEGNLIPAFVLLTDQALYILRRGERNGRFSTETRIPFNELDYVLIGLNYQSIQLVCRNRRRQFWLSTGSETLTRFVLYAMKTIMLVDGTMEPLCVLTDATTQAIGLKKYAAGEEKKEMSEVKVHLYSLVHWEDLLDSSTAADLQLYMPATKRKGMLHYKTKESFFVGSYWKGAYFKLKHNTLKRYGRKGDDEPDMSIHLGSTHFGGCRRVHHSDRKFCFELVFTNDWPPLALSCENELQLSQWLQSICEVVSHLHVVSQNKGPQPNPCQPSCAVITSESLLLCLEDCQTHFFRTLAMTSLTSISAVEQCPTTDSYVLLNFRNSECDNPWLLYFNSRKEQTKFVTSLMQAYLENMKMDLKLTEITDTKLKQRCTDCQLLIQSSWQRSDSLERGRVRGDSW